MTGENAFIDNAFSAFNSRSAFGTVSHGSETLRRFELNIIRIDEYTLTIDGDDKLEAVESSPLFRPRKRQRDQEFNHLEHDSFVSIN